MQFGVHIIIKLFLRSNLNKLNCQSRHDSYNGGSSMESLKTDRNPGRGCGTSPSPETQSLRREMRREVTSRSTVESTVD